MAARAASTATALLLLRRLPQSLVVTKVTEPPLASRQNKSMKPLEEMTVGEIAARSAASARVFEKHGINFCCAGQIPVADACLARRLDTTELFHELEQTTDSRENGLTDWQTAPIGGLIDHIVNRHHEYLKTQLPGIEARLEKVLRRHSTSHTDVLS
jgi:regulator of cell morphogenesis and NO signaling